MTAKLDYRWHLREVMAHEGIYSTSALGPLLAERASSCHPARSIDL